MKKMVNGKEVELTLEEERELLAYQAIMKAEDDAQIKAREDKINKKKEVMQKIQNILGLSDEEIRIVLE